MLNIFRAASRPGEDSAVNHEPKDHLGALCKRVAERRLAPGPLPSQDVQRMADLLTSSAVWRGSDGRAKVHLTLTARSLLRGQGMEEAEAANVSSAMFRPDPVLELDASPRRLRACEEQQQITQETMSERCAQLEAQLARAEAALAREQEARKSGEESAAHREKAVRAELAEARRKLQNDRNLKLSLSALAEAPEVIEVSCHGEHHSLRKDSLEQYPDCLLSHFFGGSYAQPPRDAAGRIQINLPSILPRDFVFVSLFLGGALPSKMTRDDCISAERVAEALRLPELAEAARARSEAAASWPATSSFLRQSFLVVARRYGTLLDRADTFFKYTPYGNAAFLRSRERARELLPALASQDTLAVTEALAMMMERAARLEDDLPPEISFRDLERWKHNSWQALHRALVADLHSLIARIERHPALWAELTLPSV